MQLIGVKDAIIDLLKEMKHYKYIQTIVVTFEKPKIIKKEYFNSKPKKIINNNEISETLLKSN